MPMRALEQESMLNGFRGEPLADNRLPEEAREDRTSVESDGRVLHELPRTAAEAFAPTYTAFLDVLGYRNIANEAPTSANSYDVLRAIVETNANFQVGDGLGRVVVRRTVFSDSIVLSAPYDIPGLWSLLLTISGLVDRLLRFGVLVRGGVAEGLLYHSSSAVFGPSIARAYDLESKVASVPRIVIGRNVYQAAMQAPEFWAKSFARQHLRQASDGPAFLHTLFEIQGRVRRALVDATPSKPVAYAHLSEASQLRDFLQGALHLHMDDPRTFEKYRWFATYFNNEVHAELLRHVDQSYPLAFLPVELP
jgi:hypothetical protein